MKKVTNTELLRIAKTFSDAVKTGISATESETGKAVPPYKTAINRRSISTNERPLIQTQRKLIDVAWMSAFSGQDSLANISFNVVEQNAPRVIEAINDFACAAGNQFHLYQEEELRALMGKENRTEAIRSGFINIGAPTLAALCK